MIVTTNLTFESRTEVLGSERLTRATLDRVTHRCKIIETNGESYRLHDAKTRGRRTRPGPAVDGDAQADRQVLTQVLPFSTGARSLFRPAFTTDGSAACSYVGSRCLQAMDR
jgi:IstB-like ATP binding protein